MPEAEIRLLALAWLEGEGIAKGLAKGAAGSAAHQEGMRVELLLVLAAKLPAVTLPLLMKHIVNILSAQGSAEWPAPRECSRCAS